VVRNRGQRCGNIELTGHLYYPNNVNGSLHETDANKIRQYRADYTYCPSNVISFMPTIASTSGSLHSELVSLSFCHFTDSFFVT
jgi:hypothetical protein